MPHVPHETAPGPKARRKIPHDEIWKKAFEIFLGNLVELVDPELASILDLDQAKVLQEDPFADFPGRQVTRADLVAETPTRNGDEELVMVHAETETRYRQAMDRRMRRYGLHTEVKYDKPVVPIAVFLNGGPAGVELREVPRAVGSHRFCDFRYFAFGLSGCLAEEWLERPQPLAAALAALMRSRVWDKVEQKLRCLQAISRAEVDDTRRYVLAKIVDTYVDLEAEDEERFQAELEQKANQEVSDMVITLEEAIAEAEARGQARGEAKEAREAILLVLNRRLGSLPASFVGTLEKISDLSRLHDILDQALTADSLDRLDVDA